MRWCYKHGEYLKQHKWHRLKVTNLDDAKKADCVPVTDLEDMIIVYQKMYTRTRLKLQTPQAQSRYMYRWLILLKQVTWLLFINKCTAKWCDVANAECKNINRMWTSDWYYWSRWRDYRLSKNVHQVEATKIRELNLNSIYSSKRFVARRQILLKQVTRLLFISIVMWR